MEAWRKRRQPVSRSTKPKRVTGLWALDIGQPFAHRDRGHGAIGIEAPGPAAGLGRREIVEKALRRQDDKLASRNLSRDYPLGIVDALGNRVRRGWPLFGGGHRNPPILAGLGDGFVNRQSR